MRGKNGVIGCVCDGAREKAGFEGLFISCVEAMPTGSTQAAPNILYLSVSYAFGYSAPFLLPKSSLVNAK